MFAGSTIASVITTESIVAKAGANIPAPFAIPEMSEFLTEAVAIFGLVSVVIIARALFSMESEVMEREI